MHRLITRCLSDDYQTVTDNHDDNDRGELELDALVEALHHVSYIMPFSADPESPHRPAIGVQIAEKDQQTFFYNSDFQGNFCLNPADKREFSVDNILDLIAGKTTIEQVKRDNISYGKKVNRSVYIVLGAILLVLLYFILTAYL